MSVRDNSPLRMRNKEVAVIEQNEPAKSEITRRAYALYLMRGCEQGRDVEDWVKAEKELTDESVVEGISRYTAFLA
jgi:hypothetical protein